MTEYLSAYFVLRFLHIVGATVFLGTGSGIAFFMLMAHRQGDPAVIAGTARIVVIADYVFTATAVLAQPVTGILLARATGHSLGEGWIVASSALYVFTGLFWLPVVRMQTRMRDLASTAVSRGEPLPAEYHALFRRWFAFGFPAFGAVLGILWLMITRPSF